jgi:putative membrane protein
MKLRSKKRSVAACPSVNFQMTRKFSPLIKFRPLALTLSLAAVLGFAAVTSAHADGFSDQDKIFVAKVSQGGMYEVALGKLAEDKGVAQDIKDSGNTEAHDHMLVGAKLKSIMEANRMAFPTSLNSDSQSRLDKMSALPANQFDAAYIHDMKKIHAADGAAFLKESTAGSNPDLKAFAAETYRIVQRHLGELGATTH